MSERIEEIKKRRARFTSGQLEYNQEGEIHHKHATGAWVRIVKCTYVDDTVFLAHAPEDIDYLIAEYERLEKENEEMHERDADSEGLISDYSEQIDKLRCVVACATDYYIAKEKIFKTKPDSAESAEAKIEAGNKYMLLLGALSEIDSFQQAIKEYEK